ncbi:MAG: exosortase/archaeosortase family protein [Bacteroidales bacterium]|nr:exosortase/archaeosortase family protein [Bacteroidales bacterium]
MKEKNILQKYNLNKSKIITGLLIIILGVSALYIKQNPEGSVYRFLSNTYSHILIFGSSMFLKLFSGNYTFDYAQNTIISAAKIIKVNTFFYSLNQIALCFLIVFISPSPYRKKILYFVAAIFIYTLYNTFRLSIHIIYPDTVYTKNILFNFLLIPQWLILIALTYYYWQKFPDLINYIFKKYKIKHAEYRNFVIKLSIVTVFYYLMIIIVYNTRLGRYLVEGILGASNYFINLLAYDTVLIGRIIRSQEAALYMDDSCVGINLMYLFVAFIFLLPGSFKHKLWFIPAGLFAIIAYNILRIVLIYVSIANNDGKYVLPIEIHDVFTYPVLAFTFYMWTLWINKFVIEKKR